MTTDVQNSVLYDEYLAMKTTKEIGEFCVFRRDVYLDKFVLTIAHILILCLCDIKLSDVRFILKLKQLVNSMIQSMLLV